MGAIKILRTMREPQRKVAGNARGKRMKMLELDVPEYFVTHIGRAEKLASHIVRFTMCVQDNGVLHPRYKTIWPTECILSRTELARVVGKEIMGDCATH